MQFLHRRPLYAQIEVSSESQTKNQNYVAFRIEIFDGLKLFFTYSILFSVMVLVSPHGNQSVHEILLGNPDGGLASTVTANTGVFQKTAS